MNRQETLAIMSVLKAAYPNFYKDMGRSDAESIVGLWEEMFKDDPAEVVAMAVKSHIANDRKGYPPHIGAIKDAIVKLHTRSTEMTELEAWGLVRKAIGNSNYEADKEFNKLPANIRRLVGSPNQLREWAMMDSDVVGSVVASNFQRSYKARVESDREYRALPSDVRETMLQLAGAHRVPGIEEDETGLVRLSAYLGAQNGRL